MSCLHRFAALAVLVLTLAACSTASPTADPADANGDWRLERGTLRGAAIPIVVDHPITLSIDGTEAGGQSACNFYGAQLDLTEGGARIGLTSSTDMACGDLGGDVMRSEAAFQEALVEVRAARIEADRLTLAGPAVELVFSRRAPIPMNDIVETDWLLESVVDREGVAAAVGDPAPLRYEDDGTFHGGTGCRTFAGKWIVAYGRLMATDQAMEGDCPDGLGGQDQAVAEGAGGSTPTIDGDRLTLTINGGTSLVYRRATE